MELRRLVVGAFERKPGTLPAAPFDYSKYVYIYEYTTYASYSSNFNTRSQFQSQCRQGSATRVRGRANDRRYAYYTNEYVLRTLVVRVYKGRISLASAAISRTDLVEYTPRVRPCRSSLREKPLVFRGRRRDSCCKGVDYSPHGLTPTFLPTRTYEYNTRTRSNKNMYRDYSTTATATATATSC